jgi:hypothetical protein
MSGAAAAGRQQFRVRHIRPDLHVETVWMETAASATKLPTFLSPASRSAFAIRFS